MLDGVLLGLSIQALDGATLADVDASVTGALSAWDPYGSGDRPAEKP
ncbi:hypothetical protein [Lichenibacterium ramalinae]|nr:hypothetical protein [Lichenibacterium ramalinae]